MPTGVENMLRWIPLVGIVTGIIATAAVAQFQINEHDKELSGLEEDIEDTEEDVEQIQRLIIQQQGRQQVEIQELRGDIKLILRLLQQNGSNR